VNQAASRSTIIVDTNVVSLILKQDSRAARYLPHLAGRQPVVSFQTVAELDAWAERAQWGPARRRDLTQILDSYLIHYPDRDLCAVWAAIREQARRSGRAIDGQDAWIAATALRHGAELVTHNPGDFVGVPGLTLITESP
jgi:predicted nucleic acid-binding protein